MISIRYIRTGKKDSAFFKLVATDGRRTPTSGKFLEELGHYNPKTKERKINADRVKYWLSQGAKPSETVHNVLVSEKIIEGGKVAVHAKKKLSEEEIAKQKEAEAAAKAAAEAPKEEAPVEEPKTEEAPKEEEKKEEPAEEKAE